MRQSGHGMDAPKRRLPSGTVTFLFTDIEGSTSLFRQLEDVYPSLLAAHYEIVGAAIASNRGVIVKTEGDAVFAAFESASDAVTACRRAQRDLAKHPWPKAARVRVRMGLHTGLAIPRDGDYVALAVHQAARVVGAAHGGQVLVTAATRALLADDVALRALGRFQLRDFDEPEALYELAGSETFPALRALPAAIHNLPRPRTSFVGREHELAELREILADSQLVTLVGAAGSGKTRLARELSLSALDDFSDGAWLVELATLSRPDEVVPAIAHALGVREAPGEDLRAALLDRLREARLLLVLDNCEHILDPVADLVDATLETAARVHIVATSHERLGVPGERIWNASPLAVPSPGSSIAEAAGFGAVQLFVARGTDARPGFSLTSENVAAVVDVCRRLDGLPLALELAAARLAALTPGQISDRLDARFDLLAGGRRTGLARHRTLRATLDWSYELLSSIERRVLRRVSVFVGAFSIDAAEAVVQDHEIPEPEVAALVERLVEHSLLDGRGHGRFLTLETIRQYGLLRLAEAGEEQEARGRHLEWVAAAVERAANEEEDAWYDRIEADYAELRSAVTWSLTGGQPSIGLRAVASTGSFLADRARAAEGRNWLDALLEYRDDAAPQTIADALSIRSRLGFLNGEYDVAQRASSEGLAIAQAAEDGARVSAFVRQLGNVALYEGRIEDARRLYGTAVEEAGEDELCVVRAQLNLGLAELMLGRLDVAERQFTEMLAIGERAHPGEVPYGRSALAMVAMQRGDGAAAAGLIADAIEGFQARSNLYELAELVEMAGGASLLAGDGENGTRLLGASDSVYEAAGGVRPDGFFADRYQGWVQTARSLLGDHRVAELMAAGRGLRLTDAVGIAHEKMKELRQSSRGQPRRDGGLA